jgi:hypothetical protein
MAGYGFAGRSNNPILISLVFFGDEQTRQMSNGRY